MPSIQFKAPPLRWTWSRLGTKISATLIWLALCAALLISFKMAIINGSILALLGACVVSLLFFFKPALSMVILAAQRSSFKPRSLFERVMKGLILSLVIAAILTLAVLNGHWMIGTVFSIFLASLFRTWYLSNQEAQQETTFLPIETVPILEARAQGHHYSELTLHLSSGEKVEGAIFRPEHYNPQGLHVVYFMGNGGHLAEHCAGPAIFPKASMHLWHNYLGVDGSTSSVHSAEDLMRAGAAQVEYLLAQGVKADNILLYGQSLGAATAVLCARYFHDCGHPVHCLNDRSFSSLGAFLAGEKPPSPESRVASLRRALEGNWPTDSELKSQTLVKKKTSLHRVSWKDRVLITVGNTLAGLLGWHGMNIASVYASLPEGNKKCVAIKEDETIPYGKTSLYSHLKKKALHKERNEENQDRKKYNDAMKLVLQKGITSKDVGHHNIRLQALFRKSDLKKVKEGEPPNAAESLFEDIEQGRFSRKSLKT